MEEMTNNFKINTVYLSLLSKVDLKSEYAACVWKLFVIFSN